MRWPEDERHPFPIEIAFTIAGQLFALEHAGIEPFGGHVQMEAEASRHFTPIMDALKNALGVAAVRTHHPGQRLSREEHGGPAHPAGGHRLGQGHSANAAEAALRRLSRHEHGLGHGARRAIWHIALPVRPRVGARPLFSNQASGSERGAVAHRCIRKSVEKKFPKLAAWKHDHKARTILVVEDNDIQLTNEAIVTETFLPLAMARKDRPDETYVIDSCMDPWHAWPVLVDGKSYFDFAQAGDPEDWAIDPTKVSTFDEEIEFWRRPGVAGRGWGKPSILDPERGIPTGQIKARH